MKLEQQVCSLELAKRLKELGMKQESLFYWSQIQSPEWSIRRHDELNEVVEGGEGWTFLEEGLYRGDVCSAFTVAELGEFLGGHFHLQEFWNQGNGKNWMVEGGEKESFNYEYETKRFLADTEADARAKLLIYLLENKLI